ncbi:hypothetical protein NP233_g4553 [Leucocoprinus birnbaumii]|uniref:Mitochondrial carrier n=1 Tax=Leucocoprinus birnbaumii TaxID=56174 RepID=A0AAD5VUS6_9AGAR|nr:hypothetical protein NP233_g4553 [Leucocoprinus birnbaumii]
MHRNMSYRKPAPAYVPSPPTSPAVGSVGPSFLTVNRGNQLNHLEAKEKPLPTIPPTKTQEVSKTKPLTSSKGINIEPVPVTRQTSKARTTSSGALSNLNYCSDSENTIASSTSVANNKPTRRTPSQRSRQAYNRNKPYRPPTPPRHTEHRRYSRGYTSTILQKDDGDRSGSRRVSTSTNNQHEGLNSQDTYYESNQLQGRRRSRKPRAESMRTSPSCMTERTQFSFGVSEAWSGGVTLNTSTEVCKGFPVPSTTHKEAREKGMSEVDEFELIHSSFWDKMGISKHFGVADVEDDWEPVIADRRPPLLPPHFPFSAEPHRFVRPAYSAIDHSTMAPTIESTNTHQPHKPLASKLPSDSIQPNNQRRTSSDPPQPHSLEEFRQSEGRENRKRRLQALWNRLPPLPLPKGPPSHDTTTKPLGPEGLTYEKAESIRAKYDDELLVHCRGSKDKGTPERVGWGEFKENGQLDADELRSALNKSGIQVSPEAFSEFMSTLAASSDSRHITFAEFRDFLLLLPRKASPEEIYRYYEVSRFMGDDGRGPARVTMEGDVSLSAEDKPPDSMLHKHTNTSATNLSASGSHPPPSSAQSDRDNDSIDYLDDDEDEEEHQSFLERHSSLRFLLAGGIAGAVSRTCTAPFDRLKVFLITRPPDLGGVPVGGKTGGVGGVKIIANAVARIYAEGGVLAFWTGNGLNALLPSIYPLETLKTQMMSNTGGKRTFGQAIRHLYSMGGIRAYYRGLTVGLVGVFPYSAIDMSTFEALKIAYVKSTGKEEPGVMALLAFGSISGSVGATSVYPLNLVRTRLQASGSSGHPQTYTGVWDVTVKTWERDGWRGFYRGLFPTLAKVVPAVSISYVVYEHSKRRLGV